MPYMLSCDSTTDLTLPQYAAIDLHYVSLHFLLDGKEYPDDYGQSLPMKTFFDAMAAGATTGTSQVTTGEFELYFRQFLEQNRQYWDYVDQELLDRMRGVTRVKFYVTDDENHIPVRLDMFLKFGSAKAFLVGMRGAKNPVKAATN